MSIVLHDAAAQQAWIFQGARLPRGCINKQSLHTGKPLYHESDAVFTCTRKHEQTNPMGESWTRLGGFYTVHLQTKCKAFQGCLLLYSAPTSIDTGSSSVGKGHVPLYILTHTRRGPCATVEFRARRG